eukprot:scaffold2619_cov129-Cylindrotheca_fusiformis.AAC.15
MARHSSMFQYFGPEIVSLFGRTHPLFWEYEDSKYFSGLLVLVALWNAQWEKKAWSSLSWQHPVQEFQSYVISVKVGTLSDGAVVVVVLIALNRNF